MKIISTTLKEKEHCKECGNLTKEVKEIKFSRFSIVFCDKCRDQLLTELINDRFWRE